MKKGFIIFFVVLWSVLLAAGLLYYVAGTDNAASFSEKENRMLASLPELSVDNVISGEFENSVEDYLLDHFWNRDSIIQASNTVRNIASIASYEDSVAIVEDKKDELTEEVDEEEYDELWAELLEGFGADVAKETDISGAEETAGASYASGEDGISVAEGIPGVKDAVGEEGNSGAHGEPGAAGATGVADASGDEGDSGAHGEPGDAGTTGVADASGDEGDSGAHGEPGDAGTTGVASTSETVNDKDIVATDGLSSATSDDGDSNSTTANKGGTSSDTDKVTVSIEDFPSTLGIYGVYDGVTHAYREYSIKSVLSLTAVLNKYAEVLPEEGKLIFTLVAQSTHCKAYISSKNKDRMYNTFDEVISAFGNSKIRTVDSLAILSEAINRGEYVYFRTDMHWNTYGSYLTYCEMILYAGKTPVDYEKDFVHQTEEPFLGTYYRDNPTSYYKKNPDSLELLTPVCNPVLYRVTGKDTHVEIPFLDMNAASNDRYTVYLGGPAGPWTYCEADNGKEDNCLVIMDSFGLGFFPMLVGNYKQVHYYDPRYYDYETVGYTVKEMIEKYDIKDIYVVIGDLHSFKNDFLLKQANQQFDGR